MNKIALVLLVVVMSLGMASCNQMGMSQWTKEITSGTTGLNRHTEVRNSFTDRVVFEFDGVAYISDAAAPGDITLITVLPGGEKKKVDFIGQSVYLFSIEK